MSQQSIKVAVILPAAGAGKRFASGEGVANKNKVELELNGRPVLLRTAELFLKRPQISQIVVAANPDHLDAFKFRWGDQLAFHGVTIVAGGRLERWESVKNALAAITPDCTHVAVHDVVRPLASPQLLNRLLDAAARWPAVIPALPVSNTLKMVQTVELEADHAHDPLDAILGAPTQPASPLMRVVRTLDRTGIMEVQTPQIFSADLLRRAYALVESNKIDRATITDDAMLVEALGEPVWIVEGDPTNIKITRPGDAALAEALLRMTEQAASTALGKKRLFADEED
jgi:2-C-methyl-D-erythritol 4-phosphate cytidylyltransferase